MGKQSFRILVFLALSTSAFSQWSEVSPGLLSGNTSFGGAITFKNGKLWTGIGSLFVSQDTGISWTSVSSFYPNQTICSIDFFDEMNGLVVTYSGGGGAYTTNDGGATWNQSLQTSDCLSGTFGATKNILVVVGRSGFMGHIFVSSDAGLHWNETQIENGGGAYHVATHKNGDIFVLARNVSPTRSSYIYTSKDNGVTWTKGNLDIDLDCYSFTFGSCKEDALYIFNEAFNEEHDTDAVIYKTDLNANTPTRVYTSQHAKISGSGTYAQKTVFTQTRYKGILRTEDEGQTWINIGGPSAHWDSRFICAINDNVIVGVDTNGSVWRTNNSGGFPVPASPVLKGGRVVSGSRVTAKKGDTVGVDVIVKLPSTTDLSSTIFDEAIYSVFYEDQLFSLNQSKISSLVVPPPGWVFKKAEFTHNNVSIYLKNTTLQLLTNPLYLGRLIFTVQNVSKDRASSIFLTTENLLSKCETLGDTFSIEGFDPLRHITVLTSGIGDNSIPQNEDITLFPNPTNESVVISTEMNYGIGEVTVVNLLGEKILSVRGELGVHSPLSLDVRSLASGMYFVKIECNGIIHTKSVVIRR